VKWLIAKAWFHLIDVSIGASRIYGIVPGYWQGGKKTDGLTLAYAIALHLAWAFIIAASFYAPIER
jgi:hypothetical protein